MMDHTIRVTIPFQAGMSEPQMMLHILRLQTDAAKQKGWRSGGYKPNMTADQIVQDLKRNQRDVVVHLTKTRSGLRARRVRASPSITIADASGAVDLEKAAKKFTPELTGFALAQMSEKLGARKLALDTAIYGTPGLDRSVRLSAIQGGKEDLALSKVVGYEPNRGASIDAMAAGKLKALIQKSMLDLGIEEGDERTKKAQEQLMRGFRSKFTLLEEDLIGSFMYMVHAHHEVREMNLPYIEAMMTGMKGAEFPEALLSMLSPSPDDFFKGTDAMLIIDSKNKPQQTTGRMQGISNKIVSLWTSILNVKDRDRPVSVTDKQREVASLLDAFNNDRVKMVQAIERACRRARRRGGDFISAFRAYPLGDRMEAKEAAAALKAMVVAEAGDLIDGGDLYNLTTGDADGSYREDVLAELEKNGMANRIGDTEYFIVPMAMPRFPMQPVGWDRRWMVATMRIIDEYWNVIYGTDGLFISDLLYLIASRAYELFNYSMDSEDLLLLTVLLLGDQEDGDGDDDDDDDDDDDEDNVEVVEDEEPEVMAAPGFDDAAAALEDGEGEAEEEAEEEELPDTREDEAEADEEAGEDEDLVPPREGGNFMNIGDQGDSRRASRGILPRPKNSRRKKQGTLRTVGDLIGISGVVSGQAKEITKLKRDIQTKQDDVDRLKRDVKAANEIAEENIATIKSVNREIKQKLAAYGREQRDKAEAQEALNTALELEFEAVKDRFSQIRQKAVGSRREMRVEKEKLEALLEERDTQIRDMTEEHLSEMEKIKDEYEKSGNLKKLAAEARVRKANQDYERANAQLQVTKEQIDEQVDRIEALQKEIAIKESQYQFTRGEKSKTEEELRKTQDNLAALRETDLARAQKLERLMMGEPATFATATELRNLGNPMLARLAPQTIMEMGKLSREKLNDFAEQMGIFNPEEYGSKGALVQAMLDMADYTQQEMIDSVVNGGRRASRKARNTTVAHPNITITRADGKGKDLGLVTAEVLVGVNIFSDIATAIRDFFGGRSKSGQNKLKTAIALLIAEMKEKAGSMGADSISNFHAEPFMYGSNNSMIGLYGFGVARKTGRKTTTKKNPFNKQARSLNQGYEGYTDEEDEMSYRAHTGNIQPGDIALYEWKVFDATGTHIRSADSEDEADWMVKNLPTMMGGPDTRPGPWTYERGSRKGPSLAVLKTQGIVLGKDEVYRKSNPQSEARSYKGMIISKTKDGWKVDAFDKDFKTLKMARDFISKQVKGAASANSQCPRVIGRVRCRGTVKKGRVHWKCNACHAEFREAK